MTQNQTINILEDGQTLPRYVVKVKDAYSKQLLKRRNYQIFIVPLNQERSILFNQQDKINELFDQIRAARISFVFCQNGFDINSMEQIQEELEQILLQFQPFGCKNQLIQFMTSGQMSQRKVVLKEGNLLIEDLIKPNGRLRELSFLTSTSIAQSEIWLTEKNGSLVPDYRGLSAEYMQSMIAGLSLSKKNFMTNQLNGLVLGLGGGVLVGFLLHNFENFYLTAVDLDMEIIQVAQQYFLQDVDTQRLQIICDDALNFVDQSEQKYDFIIIDILDSGALNDSPPPPFRTPDFIQSLSKLHDDGPVMINILAEPQALQEYCQIIQQTYETVYHRKCELEANQLIYCTKEEALGQIQLQRICELVIAQKQLNPRLPEIAGSIKQWQKVSQKDTILSKNKRRRRKR